MILLSFISAYLLVPINGQSTTVVSNVHVIDHREYMTEVISETVKEVEKREWCNLKLDDIKQEFDELVVNWHLNGTVTYSNGFVVSIGNLDILESSLQQVWARNDSHQTVQVDMRGQLRMTDVALGYDVIVNLVDGDHHFTAFITHPLVKFGFNVFRNAFTHEMWVAVARVEPEAASNINILPQNKMSDAISALFNSRSTEAGVTSWATQVFLPIASEVVTRVSFPGICYNCPVS